MDYGSFQKEALEQFKTLPEEKDELYKRYFIALPLAKMGEKIVSGGGNSFDAENFAKELSMKLLTKFDAVFWSGGYSISNKNYISALKVEAFDDAFIDSKMYKSGEDKLAAFVHAFSSVAVRIEIPQKTDAKINLLIANNNVPLTLQIFVNVGQDSSLSLFEYYCSNTNESTLLGAMHEIKIGDYSNAELNFVHNEDKNTISVGLSKATVGGNSILRENFAYNGASITRARNRLEVMGREGQAEVNEIILSSAEQKLDIATNIINGAESTNAVLESRAALMDRSSCLLKGSALIRKNAAGSRSYVNERGIMLDKETHIDSIPSMSIENNNVKATHSSATAPIDEEQLFYLMSRGADESVAKKLIVDGFLGNNIAKIEAPTVKLVVASLFNEKMTRKSFGDMPQLTTENMWIASSAQRTTDIFKGHYKYRGE